ncbi:MAG: GIY-YIG nuclease family protein [Betaproteobacteria bacterium]|nr:GIY-YIG nuclease family protein [Betaproteobacteria bacterium]
MFTPLSGWLDRRHPIPQRFYTPGHIDTPSKNWGAWLSIEECNPLHLATEMQWLSLKDARERTQNYLAEASELIRGLDGGWLDRWEQEQIKTELGDPPPPSLPIYLISCVGEEKEELVYVGKTKNTSRFDGGHSAALKLHAPDYINKKKNIYRSTVWFYVDDEYISLDWIQPDKLALELLDSLESQLIYNFQPTLNTHKKKKNLTKWDFQIHIQNFLAGGFLNDVCI